MERSLQTNEAREHADFNDAYDVEQQLESAERRYAQARDACIKAREEWRAISVQHGATAASIRAAKIRFDAVAARCARLHALIEKLERRLDE